MTLSVLIPIYNAQNTLERAINSVLKQTLLPHEIICCLNKCTDNTKEILSNLAKQNGTIKIIEQNSHSGIVPTLNKCLENVSPSCTLIARQDADDFWFPNKLEKQVEFLVKNPDVSILGTQIELVKPNTFEKISNTTYPLDDIGIKTSLFSACNVIAHPSVIFKRDILLRTGGYQDLFPLCEDMDLWLRASKWFKFANLSDILVSYTSTQNPAYTPISPQLCTHNMKLVLQHFPK